MRYLLDYNTLPRMIFVWGINSLVASVKLTRNPLFPQIADFGLSNLYHKDKLLQTFCGSPLYASPEIVNGRPYRGPEVRPTEPNNDRDQNPSCLCVNLISTTWFSSSSLLEFDVNPLYLSLYITFTIVISLVIIIIT